MTSPASLIAPSKSRACPATLFRVLIFMVIATLFSCTTRIAAPITTSTEMFHEGEYVGSLWHMAAWQSNKAPFPLLIHGAMDYSPSQVALKVYGKSRIIGGTRVINTLIVLFTWLVFMELVYQMTAPTLRTAWRIGLAVGLFALLAPPWFSLPVQVTEAFVGIRDSFLLLILLANVHFWKAARRWSPVLAATCAGLLPFAAAWSYDRGLIAAGLIGLMMGAMAWHRRWHDLIAAAVSLAIVSLLLGQLRFFGSFAGNGQNILYWLSNSAVVWGLPFKFPELDSVLGAMLTGLCLLMIGLSAQHLRNNSTPASVVPIAGLLVVQILLAKTSLNRPSGVRVLASLYPSVLILVHIATHRLPIRSNAARPPNIGSPWQLQSTLLYPCGALLGLIIALIALPRHPLTMAGLSFFKTLRKPAIDLRMVPPEVAKLGLKLRTVPEPFLFGWSNEGVLNLLARKRWATRFSYSVYASPASEPKLLAELKSLNAQIIVTRPNDWAMNIDGRSMAERLPATAKYIDSQFPFSKKYGTYTLLACQPILESPMNPPALEGPAVE